MRLLHTSDWHLGRSFHGFGLLDAQESFLWWLLDLARSEHVDALVVAGDVFDRAIPPVDAVALYDELLSRLSAMRISTVVISGNHDSAERLGVGSRLIAQAGVHVRTDPRGICDPVLLADDHGPVAFYPIPYLEPDAVSAVLAVEGRGHQATLAASMDVVRRDLAGRRARSVVLSHAFVTGGEASDSERDIRVGGTSNVASATFDGVDYVALGHLHGAQQLTPRVAYSGSPVAYSFSEARHNKSVTLVDLGPDGSVRTTRAATPVGRQVARIRGRLDELMADPSLSSVEAAYVAVTLTDPGAVADPMKRLRARFPYAATLDWQPDGGLQRAEGTYGEILAGRTDEEIALHFVQHVRNSPATEEEACLLRASLEPGRARVAQAHDAEPPEVALPGTRVSSENVRESVR